MTRRIPREVPACICMLPDRKDRGASDDALAGAPRALERKAGDGPGPADWLENRAPNARPLRREVEFLPPLGQDEVQRGQGVERKAGERSRESPRADERTESRPVSAWREAEFDLWLEQTLSQERAAVIGRLQTSLSQRLADHHKVLGDELEVRFGQSVAAASVNMDAGTGASRGPEALAQPVNPTNGVVQFVPADAELMRMGSKATTSSGVDLSIDAGANSHPTPTKAGGRQSMVQQLRRDPSSMGMTQLSLHRRWLRRMVHNHTFELVSCLLIFANTLTIAAEVQYIGHGIGVRISHPDTNSLPANFWPDAAKVFNILATLFTIAFVMEFICRVAFLKLKALKSFWIWMDALVLVFDIVDTANRLGGDVELLMVNPSVMRTARIARMMRMVKVLKTKEAFYTLFLLMKSILASRHALLWAFFILFCTMTAVGVMVNQMVFNYLNEPGGVPAEKLEIYDYWGTYTRMLITMCEITLGNWAPPIRTLMVNVSQWWGLSLVMYRCIFCFALVNVTNAVFITETNRVASDEEVLMMRQERLDRKHKAVLADIFDEIDESGDGLVTSEEFAIVLDDKVMRNLLAMMDLEVREVEDLFQLMDDGHGEVEKDKFISGILALKGGAKNSSQMKIEKLLKGMNKKLEEVDLRLKGQAPRPISPSRR